MLFLRRRYLRNVLRPMSRMNMSPEAIRLTMVIGLVWGMSATVGVQVIGIALTWVILKPFGHSFNPPLALVVTTVSNPFTMTPLYTLFFLTGCAAWADCHRGDYSVRAILRKIDEVGFWQTMLESWQFFAIALYGSIPYAIAGGIAGYYIGGYIGRRLHARRRRKEAALARTEMRPR